MGGHKQAALPCTVRRSIVHTDTSAAMNYLESAVGAFRGVALETRTGITFFIVLWAFSAEDKLSFLRKTCGTQSSNVFVARLH